MSLLSDLRVGESGVLVALDLPESVQNHLMHMGFVPEARVTALRRAPAGDPTVYAIDGIEIALRRETASAIQLRAAAPPALRNGVPTADAATSAKTAGSNTGNSRPVGAKTVDDAKTATARVVHAKTAKAVTAAPGGLAEATQ